MERAVRILTRMHVNGLQTLAVQPAELGEAHLPTQRTVLDTKTSQRK